MFFKAIFSTHFYSRPKITPVSAETIEVNKKVLK
jgi:hypothetical protein